VTWSGAQGAANTKRQAEVTALPRSQQRRVLARAAQAWTSGQPHKALDILEANGMADMKQRYVRIASREMRLRFLALMDRDTTA
jgi:hypothetical protein